jgi:hypothetical protein
MNVRLFRHQVVWMAQVEEPRASELLCGVADDERDTKGTECRCGNEPEHL